MSSTPGPDAKPTEPSRATTPSAPAAGWGPRTAARQSNAAGPAATPTWNYEYQPEAAFKASVVAEAHRQGLLAGLPDEATVRQQVDRNVSAKYGIDFGSFNIQGAYAHVARGSYISRDEIAMHPLVRLFTPQSVVNLATTVAKKLDNRHQAMLAEAQNARLNALAAQYDALTPEQQRRLITALTNRGDEPEVPIGPKWD